jgi:hypothetical protein
MTESDIAALRQDFHKLEISIISQIAKIDTLINTESSRCPYREQISDASDAVKKLNEIEVIVTAMRVDGAKAGATGGGVMALIVGVIFGVGKAAGWW